MATAARLASRVLPSRASSRRGRRVRAARVSPLARRLRPPTTTHHRRGAYDRAVHAIVVGGPRGWGRPRLWSASSAGARCSSRRARARSSSARAPGSRRRSAWTPTRRRPASRSTSWTRATRRPWRPSSRRVAARRGQRPHRLRRRPRGARRFLDLPPPPPSASSSTASSGARTTARSTRPGVGRRRRRRPLLRRPRPPPRRQLLAPRHLQRRRGGPGANPRARARAQAQGERLLPWDRGHGEVRPHGPGAEGASARVPRGDRCRCAESAKPRTRCSRCTFSRRARTPPGPSWTATGGTRSGSTRTRREGHEKGPRRTETSTFIRVQDIVSSPRRNVYNNVGTGGRRSPRRCLARPPRILYLRREISRSSGYGMASTLLATR